jgi:hypothetical protein
MRVIRASMKRRWGAEGGGGRVVEEMRVED